MKKKKPSMELVVIGNTSIDKITVDDKKPKTVPGGSAPAVLTAATAYGTKAGAVTKIGDDYPTNWLVDLTSRGVDMSGVSSKPASCRFELTYDSKGNLKKFNEIFNPEDALSMNDIPENYLKAKYFHLSAAHPKNQKRFLAGLKTGASISLTLWPTYKNEYTPKFVELLNKVEVLFCNNHEAKMIANEENVYDAVKKIQKNGPKVIVLTKGHMGSAIYYKNEFLLYPALRTNTIDVTGCGDAFAGGFLAEYIKSSDVEKAGWVGAALASFTISKLGSWFPLVPQTRINQRIKRAKELFKKGSSKKVTLMDFF